MSLRRTPPPSAVLIETYTNGFACQKSHLRIIATWDDGWEHVSVSTADRVPDWYEMCRVKVMMWQREDAVMQLHPRESQYVNCLHLWRPLELVIPEPPSYLVGPGAGVKS